MRNLNPTAFMRKILLTISMGLAVSGATVFNSAAQQTGMAALFGHVPAAVKQLRPTGRLQDTTNLNLAIGLPLRNQPALDTLLQQLYDPARPNYRRFLTPAEFTAQFGPTEQDYQKVIDFAKSAGLTVTRTHGNRMLVDVTGKVSDIEKAFHVTLRTYQHPSGARQFYAPDVEPSVATNLPVLHVSGLDNYFLPHSELHKMPAAVTPALGSGPGGAYIGNDFRNAYVPGVSLTGSGQSVGLLEFDSGYFQSDITAYETLAGLPNVPVQPVLLDGYDGGLGEAPDEVSLDIEMVVSMAPGVSQVYVYEGDITDDILNAMAASNQVKQLSASWTYPIDAVSEQIFEQFAAQGQSFFNAAGDSDAYNAVSNPVETPADDPHITVVGGTTLSTTNGAWASETVWNWDIEYGALYDGIGGSGGISPTYAIPTWQTNIIMMTNGGSTTFRNLPDVALTADNVYVIYSGGEAGAFGGTSCATPLWAAFLALVNQQAIANGNSTMGFINPLIYELAEGPNYTNLFHDITTGNNTWSGSPNLFYAYPGYDLCSGWGTPIGPNLIPALAGAAAIPVSAPPPPYGSTMSALNGVNPNGAWELFAQDVAVLDNGTNYNGWFLNLTLANPVGSAADNQLLMTNLAAYVPLGSNAVYILAVTNYGPSSSTNVSVSDTLPSGVTFVSVSNTQGSATHNVAQLNWLVGSLATNAGAQLILTVRPNSISNFVNYATVSAETPDPNPDDDSASATVTTVVPSPPHVGGSLIIAGGNKFELSITGSSALPTVIEASTNLINWVPVYTNTTPFTYTDFLNSPYPDRFYRAEQGM
jgi:uncharacterized repeat protein (TIGR01451 family)